jgi:hypothetical protein
MGTSGPFASLLVVTASALTASGCLASSEPFSCTPEGATATQALINELKALPSTKGAEDQACDSGDPRVVYFQSADQTALIADLSRKRCTEVQVSRQEEGSGKAYECRFDVGQVNVWVERDAANGSNTAYVTSVP